MNARRVERAQGEGFTLIEVMIAIGILSLALVTVFGSNIGGARATAHARMITRATMMARCRMTEVEAYLVKNQLPPADQTVEDPPDTGGEPCCTDGITCEAKVERIELPSPANVQTSAGDALLGRAAGAMQGTQFNSSGTVSGGQGADPFSRLAGAMGAMNQTGGSGGAGSGSSLAGAGAPSPREMAGTLLTSVYPTVKPMLEGAIRKLTVSVRWSEGSVEHHFDVVEYVTNPGQTLPSGDLLNALQGQNGTSPPGTTPTTTTPTTPTTTPSFLPRGVRFGGP